MSKKIIGIAVALLLILVYLVFCMISPASYSYKDEVKITGPYKMVYVVINDMKDWPKWYSWQKADPGFKMSLGGKELSVGANFTFESSILGKGYVVQTEGYQDSIIAVNMKSSKLPNDISIGWQIIQEGTKSVYVHLNARLKGKIPFIKRGIYFGLQNKLDKLFHDDLNGMKTYIEDLVKGDFGVEKVTYDGQKYFGKLDIVPSAKIPEFYAKYYPKIYHILDSMNVKVSGAPAGLIYDWDARTGIVAIMAALPIDIKLPFMEGWSYTEVSKGECLRMKNYGNYTTLRSAHVKMNYLMDNSPYTLEVPIIEEYVTSPSQEPDTSKWLTNIYYPLEKKGGYIKTVENKQTLEDLIRMEEAERQKTLKNLLREVKPN